MTYETPHIVFTLLMYVGFPMKPDSAGYGGLGAGNAADVVAAGANILVAGSSVYNAKGGVAAGISAIRAAAQA